MRKLYCVSKAIPTLPINIEDAARSEVEIEKAIQVYIYSLPISNVVIEVVAKTTIKMRVCSFSCNYYLACHNLKPF